MVFECVKVHRLRIMFGKLWVKSAGTKRVAERDLRRLNADPEALRLATVIEASMTAEGKLWHLAAAAVIEEKRGAVSDVAAAGAKLWDIAREMP